MHAQLFCASAELGHISAHSFSRSVPQMHALGGCLNQAQWPPGHWPAPEGECARLYAHFRGLVRFPTQYVTQWSCCYYRIPCPISGDEKLSKTCSGELATWLPPIPAIARSKQKNAARPHRQTRCQLGGLRVAPAGRGNIAAHACTRR
eukprot:3305347-Prymnesium_polylepis.1